MKDKNDAQSRLERQVPLVGGKTTFREEYPQVCQLQVCVEASPPGFGQVVTYEYSLDHAPGQYGPCPNPQCVGGGCDLGSFLWEMISRGVCEGERILYCVGGERAGRRETRQCLYAFRVKVKMAYVSEG